MANQPTARSGDVPPEVPPEEGHGRLLLRIPVHFSRHVAKPARKGDPPQELSTFNVLWPGRDRHVQRIPALGGNDPNEDVDPPTIRWKTERRRMEWRPMNKKQDQAGRHPNYVGKESEVKYKSSRIATDGKMTRGAAIVLGGKLHVSLMDEMYKMTPWNAHPSAQGTAGNTTGADERGRAGYAAGDASVGASGRGDVRDPTTNQPITVQIKKHETEQQTEARMRSYAYYQQQDDQDEWKDVSNNSRYRHRTKRAELEKSWLDPPEMIVAPVDNPSMRICRDPREVYLDHVLAKGNPSKKTRMIGGHQAPAIPVAAQVKREGAIAPHVGKPLAPTANPDPDSLFQLRQVMEAAFSSHTVVSRERIFAQLSAKVNYARLNTLAAAYNDAVSDNDEDKRAEIDDQLHRWITEACGNTLKHVRLEHDSMERYLKVLEGNEVNDVFKSIVVDLLLVNDGKVKKQDVMTACERQNCRWSDALYTKIMKEYCSSGKGGVWCLKTGNEQLGGQKKPS